MNSTHDRVIDYGLVTDITKYKKLFEQRAQFHWEFYSELAILRSRIYEELKSSLRERATAFDFPKWQRAVKYKYCLSPLSTKGSLTDPGGASMSVKLIEPAFRFFRRYIWLLTKKLPLRSFLEETDPQTPFLRKSLLSQNQHPSRSCL